VLVFPQGLAGGFAALGARLRLLVSAAARRSVQP
jgi:hypothetical protein